jgi:D-alanyl-D-alanine carboxypeptidase
MPRYPRSLIIAAALIAPLATLVACGESDKADPPRAATAAPRTLQSDLQTVVAAGSPGVIALVNDGHKIRLHAAGVADTQSRRAMRPTDRYRAGSTAKSFVSTVALQLVGEGKLSLSDTVERWLPGILPYGDRVTVRQLLNLTSGVPDNEGPVQAEWIKGNMTRSWSPRELVALVADEKPDFPPGTSWAYSNTNYVLAGLVIERVTGHRLGHELAQRIFAPLHLRHTSFPVNESRIAGSHASSYALVDNHVRDVTVLNPSGTWAAGNLVSTAPDIARFWRALLGGTLLEPAQLKAMKTTVDAFPGSPVRYGLGIMKTPGPCGALWGNGGDIAGFSNTFQNSEDGTRQAGVIVNMNPAPEAVGETRGQALATARTDALRGSEGC